MGPLNFLKKLKQSFSFISWPFFNFCQNWSSNLAKIDGISFVCEPVLLLLLGSWTFPSLLGLFISHLAFFCSLPGQRDQDIPFIWHHLTRTQVLLSECAPYNDRLPSSNAFVQDGSVCFWTSGLRLRLQDVGLPF